MSSPNEATVWVDRFIGEAGAAKLGLLPLTQARVRICWPTLYLHPKSGELLARKSMVDDLSRKSLVDWRVWLPAAGDTWMAEWMGEDSSSATGVHLALPISCDFWATAVILASSSRRFFSQNLDISAPLWATSLNFVHILWLQKLSLCTETTTFTVSLERNND